MSTTPFHDTLPRYPSTIHSHDDVHDTLPRHPSTMHPGGFLHLSDREGKRLHFKPSPKAMSMWHNCSSFLRDVRDSCSDCSSSHEESSSKEFAANDSSSNEESSSEECAANDSSSNEESSSEECAAHDSNTLVPSTIHITRRQRDLGISRELELPQHFERPRRMHPPLDLIEVILALQLHIDL